MCTLITLHRCFADAPLLVAANRDEYLERPAVGPALRRFGGLHGIAPRDERAGGTWLGLNERGLFAALTNRPNAAPDPARRSRGLLVTDALAETSAARAARRLMQLPPGTYNPFNLFVSDGRDAFAIVYQEKPAVWELEPGAHVIGNADPDARSVPKVARLLDAAQAIAAGPAAAALDALAEVCRGHAEGDSPLAGACIHTPAYGTRSSTLLRRGTEPAADVFRFASGHPCENPYLDRTPLLRELDRLAGGRAGAATRSAT